MLTVTTFTLILVTTGAVLEKPGLSDLTCIQRARTAQLEAATLPGRFVSARCERDDRL